MKIAVASGKGGTGKTTLSTNLAVSFSGEREIVLVDMDVEEPNSGIFIRGELLNTFDIERDIPDWDSSLCTMCGDCRDNCNFNAIVRLPESIMVFPGLCHSCYACSELCSFNALPMKKSRVGVLNHYRAGNLTFIESRMDIGQEQSVPLIRYADSYVESLPGKDQLVIMDAPPGTSCPLIEVVKRSDYVILVTEPTPFGLNDLKLAVETVRLLHKPFGVVINRCGIGNDDVLEYCTGEKINLLASIPDSRTISRLYSEGSIACGMDMVFEKELKRIKAFIKLLI